MGIMLQRKAQRMLANAEYRTHLNDLIAELQLTDPVEIARLGAIDAMIYDMACAMDFTRRTWSSYRKRKQLICFIWQQQ